MDEKKKKKSLADIVAEYVQKGKDFYKTATAPITPQGPDTINRQARHQLGKTKH
jgi:hypothetical protein